MEWLRSYISYYEQERMQRIKILLCVYAMVIVFPNKFFKSKGAPKAPFITE
jgi:hypothetical protein